MVVAGALALVSVTYVSAEKATLAARAATKAAGAADWASVQPIFAKHCAACHAEKPTSDMVTAPPLGVMLETYDHARLAAPRVQKMAVDAEIMPLGNTTGMTRAERDALGRWIAAGAPQ
jgi:uncharacterized membrane protein